MTYKKLIIIAAVILPVLFFSTHEARGQVADSTSFELPVETAVVPMGMHPRGEHQGEAFRNIGMALVGGGLLGIACGGLWVVPMFFSKGGENVGLIMGLLGFFAALPATIGIGLGLGFTVIGLPFLLLGNSLVACPVNWRDVNYDGACQQRFALVFELSGALLGSMVKARVTAGYHINQNFFVGGGIAPGYGRRNVYYNGINEYKNTFLPVYGDFRVSFGKKVVSPYLDLSPGYDFLDHSLYGGASVGARIRLSDNSPQSLWSSIQVSGTKHYYELGLQIGWSF